MTKQEAIEFAKKIIEKYNQKGMVADALAWQVILEAITLETKSN